MDTNNKLHIESGTAEVNGILMYYEVVGTGKPLVLIHGGGSTIQTSFERLIPLLARSRQLICVELQAHGRTSDRTAPLSFEQDADDVAALLRRLNINKVDVLGFSNGANTALQIAIRHPQQCNKIIACSPLIKKNGALPQFWDFMQTGTFEQMPDQYKEAFLSINPDSAKLMNMYQKCAERMIHFKEFSDEEIKQIKAPVLWVNGDRDVATPDHILAMAKLVEGSRVAIIPGGHGEYIGEVTTNNQQSNFVEGMVLLLNQFLNNE